MLAITLLIVNCLAIEEILDIWFHSSLMTMYRAHVDNWDGRMGDLLRCRFCFGVWVSTFTTLNILIGQYVGSHGDPFLADLIQAPIAILACAKVSSWLDDWAKKWDSVPRNKLPESSSDPIDYDEESRRLAEEKRHDQSQKDI